MRTMVILIALLLQGCDKCEECTRATRYRQQNVSEESFQACGDYLESVKNTAYPTVIYVNGVPVKASIITTCK